MKYFKGILILILAASVAAECGPQYGKCADGYCCSKYGYCGKTSEYCDISAGCQSAYGICSSATTTQKTTTTTKTSTTTVNTSIPTSTNGRCGKDLGTRCPSNQCCSKYGYCGGSDEYCSVSEGCQSSYGRCGEYVSNTNLQYYYQCKNSKHWALTYDDGPYDYDMELLNYLRKRGVKATFFLNGDNVMDITSAKGKAIVKRMIRDGHVIGSHTWSHKDLTLITKAEIIEEMTKLETALQQIIGKKPAFMRPPFGAGHDDEEIAKTLSDLGYTAACLWNVDTLDWDKTGDIDYAISVFKKKLGKPILSLNHCYYKNISAETLIALTEAEIDYMLSQGYTPVTMNVCLGLDTYQK